jgi:diketogulonate reductase-like aldo/keto reductase
LEAITTTASLFREASEFSVATQQKVRDVAMSNTPLITLNNGTTMPALGLGVLDRPTRELTAGAIQAAIAHGYRLIDTAASYLNERQVGEGLVRSGIDRSDMFVTTKLWLSEYGYERALRAFDASLRRLGLEYVNLYLLHWPVPSNFDATVESYRAAEKLLAEGRARAIGVANFGLPQLNNLMERCAVIPAVNQVELHPYFVQRELRETHARLGIVTQAWSPLGNSVRRSANASKVGDPLTHPTIVELADKYGKTSAQVVLRWHIDHGISAIPKSFRPERIAANFDIFDFALTVDDIAAIDALDTAMRYGPDPEVVHATTFPITLED